MLAYFESGRAMHATDQWQALAGELVEVRVSGHLYRRGVVDDVMPDASGFWLAADGVLMREFIDTSMGFRVMTSLYPRPPKE
jgi:hypothetical protein